VNAFDPYGLWAWGLNFGGSFTIPGTEVHVGGSIGFVADHNGTFGVLLTPFEVGAGTPGGGIFGRALLATGNDTTVDSLTGYGNSGSLSFGQYSASISTSFCEDKDGNITGDVIPPVLEFGFGRGTSPQGSLTVTNSELYFRSTILGDSGRWWGEKIYQWTH
jgi:hypothetical protein